ncbi:hypothetical protein JCM10296v2_004761 [Rhodotorula toruloides]
MARLLLLAGKARKSHHHLLDPASPLFPTEILSNIFSHVPYDDSERIIEQITLNKRYFAVAYPHWIRKLTLDENDADIVYAEIGTHAVSGLVKEIDAFLCRSCCCSVIRRI